MVQRQGPSVQQRGPSFFQEYLSTNSDSEYFLVFSCFREDIDKGDKILLPALCCSTNCITSSREGIKSPMIFCLQNPTLGKLTYCGVLEFVAEEGCCYIPQWMFKMLKFPELGSPGTVCLVPDPKT